MQKNFFTRNRWNLLLLLGFVVAAVFLFYSVGNASQGTLYNVEHPEAISGPSPGGSASVNFNLFSEIGDTAVGVSDSVNFSVLHGVTYEESDTLLGIIVIPEKRVPATGNDDSHVTVEIRNVGNTVPFFSQTIDTNVNGVGQIDIAAIPPGVYDMTAKAYSHLRRLKSSVNLGAVASVDFTDAGTNKVLCGDVNLADGDNKVNSLDVTILVDSWFTINERTDLNQDGEVNSIDITNMITNFNQVGDE